MFTAESIPHQGRARPFGLASARAGDRAGARWP